MSAQSRPSKTSSVTASLMLFLCLCFIKKNVAVMIQYLGIKTRFVIFSLICNCGISCSKFQVCHPLCQASERNSKVSVRIGQRRKSEIFCIFIPQIHANILKCFYSHNIDRFCDCLPDARESSEFVRVVIVCFISDRKRCIILHGCQRFSSGIECRRITCNDFKSIMNPMQALQTVITAALFILEMR